MVCFLAMFFMLWVILILIKNRDKWTQGKREDHKRPFKENKSNGCTEDSWVHPLDLLVFPLFDFEDLSVLSLEEISLLPQYDFHFSAPFSEEVIFLLPEER